MSATFFLSQSSFLYSILQLNQGHNAGRRVTHQRCSQYYSIIVNWVNKLRFLPFLDILQIVDYAINPCDDFFLHACGGWIKNNPIPSNEPQWNQQLILKARNDQLLKRLLGDDKIRHKYVKVRTNSTDFN